MIYTYEDIVKTTKGKFIFNELGGQDVGKIITVCGLYATENCFGGRIDKVCETTIIYEREFIEDGKRKHTASCITAEGIGTATDCKVCIYDPMTGEYAVYRSDEFVYSMKSKVEFNTGILKSGSRFFMTVDGKCGIVEVEDANKLNVCFKEVDTLYGGRGMLYNVNSETLKNITLKPIEELTNCDLLLRGFTGYKIYPSLFIKLQALLEGTEVISNEDSERG